MMLIEKLLSPYTDEQLNEMIKKAGEEARQRKKDDKAKRAYLVGYHCSCCRHRE